MRGELRRSHLVVIGIEAADQPPPGGDDLAVIERDLDALAADRLAVQVERDEFQAQILVAHQPAVGFESEAHRRGVEGNAAAGGQRSEEHTSELQSLMRISYAVFCLKKKNYNTLYNVTN